MDVPRLSSKTEEPVNCINLDGVLKKPLFSKRTVFGCNFLMIAAILPISVINP